MKQFLLNHDAVTSARGVYSLTGRTGAGPFSALKKVISGLMLFVLLADVSVIAAPAREKQMAGHEQNQLPGKSYLAENGKLIMDDSFLSSTCDVQLAIKSAVKPCSGTASGKIELTGSNGVAPYTYSLNNVNSFQSSSLFENLAAGTYTAYVKDANDCISQPIQINLSGISLPSVTLSLAKTSFCISAPAIVPSGGFPAGGFYSGPGMLRGRFYPSNAGVGTHVLTYSYANENGCIGTATQTITVYPFGKVSAGPDKIVYKGNKAGTCTTLSASIDGTNPNYTYRWSTGATTKTIEVCPDQTTTYTVTATEPSGCSSTDEVTVTVDDVRCGNKLDKISVCHNGSVLCVAPEAVEAHLAHGDILGGCDNAATTNTAEAQVEVYPNPVKDKAQVKLKLPEQNLVSIEIVNTSGKVVKKLYEGHVVANQELVLEIDKSLGQDKLYIGRLITSKGVQLFKIFTE